MPSLHPFSTLDILMMEESEADEGYTNIVDVNAKDTENTNACVSQGKMEMVHGHQLRPSNRLSEFGEPIFLRTIVVNTISHQTKELSSHTWRNIKEVASDVGTVVSDVSHDISRTFHRKKTKAHQSNATSTSEEVQVLSEDDDLVVSPPSTASLEEEIEVTADQQAQQSGILEMEREKQEIQYLSMSSIAGAEHHESADGQGGADVVIPVTSENRITSLAIPDKAGDWDVIERDGIPAHMEIAPTAHEIENHTGPGDDEQRLRSLSSSSGSIFAYQGALDSLVAMGFEESVELRATLIANNGAVEQTLNALLN